MTWECRKVQTEWTRKPKKNACRRTHRGCHEGEESPCMYLLVVSMTWTWNSWDLWWFTTSPGPWSWLADELDWLLVTLSTQHRNFAQANSYCWLDQWHRFNLVIVLRRFWVTKKKGPSVNLEKEACHTGCEIILPVINQNLRGQKWTCT